MKKGKNESVWERTNVTNLLRNRKSGNYYARVKVNGKQKWRALETKLFSVAKLKLGDVEKGIRQQAKLVQVAGLSGQPKANTVGHFMAVHQQRTRDDPSLADSSKERLDSAIKAIIKTWPDLPHREINKVTRNDCQAWSVTALREGTGFVAPRAKTVRKGMSASSFNKCVDILRTVFELAREEGAIFENPAAKLIKVPIKHKRLDLPSPEQFQAIVKSIRTAGSRWAEDCADFVRLLAYTGARRREATALQWRHYHAAKNQLTIPGTKSQSSYRTVPVIPDLELLLQEIRKKRGIEPDTAPIARVGGSLEALRHACKVVGVASMTHHELRHFFATRCIESGVDIPTVSRWLGHSDGGALAMLTYGHLRQDHSQTQALKVSFGSKA